LQTSAFWASILGYLINKEEILPLDIVAMCICLAAVGLIAFNKSESNDDVSQSTAESILGIAVCFTVSWIYAFVNVINRKLKPCHYAVLGFYHPALGVIVYTIWILFDWLFFSHPLTFHSW